MPAEPKRTPPPSPAQPAGGAGSCDRDPGRNQVSLSPAAIDRVAERFRILGEPLRVRLIQELQGGEKSVSALVDAVAASQPNVSKHLRILQGAGIVGRRHEGNLVYYFITDESVFDLCDAVCASVGDRLTRDASVAAELNRGMTARRR